MQDVLMMIHTMGSLSTTDNDRYIYLAKLLIQKNTCVEIITSDFEHHKKAYRDKNIAKNYPFSFTFLHENAYQKNISLSRILGHLSFARWLRRYLKEREKPDVIYCAIPPTISSFVTAQYAKKHHIRFVIDVQDLWPESFYLAIGKHWWTQILMKPIAYFVNNTYAQADAILAVSETYVNRAAKNNIKAVQKHSIYLGTDSNTVKNILNDEKTKKPQEEFWIGYVGNLGRSYDFLHLFQALEMLQQAGIKNIKLLILGDGNMRVDVEQLSQRYFKNTFITGYLPYAQMFNILKQCDIAVNPIIAGTASSVVNKVGDYAAAGVPVINTQDNPEYRTLVETYQVGMNTIPANAEDIAKKIRQLYQDKDLRECMGKNNYRLYNDKFDRSKTYPQIVDVILSE